METPLQRVPCAVAVVLAKASEALASSPGSEVYRVVNRCGGGRFWYSSQFGVFVFFPAIPVSIMKLVVSP